MNTFTEKISIIKNSKYSVPVFLVTLFLVSIISNIFNNPALNIVLSIIILVFWLLLLIVLDFNKALIIVVCLLPFRSFEVYLKIMDVGIIVLSVAFFVLTFGIKHIINVIKKREQLLIIPLILCILCVLYGFINFDINNFNNFILNIVLFALLYIFAVNSKNVNIKTISFSFIFAVIANTGLSFVYSLSFSERIFVSGGRFQALCLNPNILHIYTTIALAILIYLFRKKICSIKIFFILFTILTIIGVLTQSKAFIVCYSILLIYLLICIFKKSKITGFSFIGVFLLCAGISLLAFGDVVTKVFDRFINAVGNNAFDKIFTGRVSVWEAYLSLWLSSIISIIFGCGVTTDPKLVSYALHPHNDYIYFLYRFGIVGALLIIATLVSFIVYSKNRKNFKMSNTLPLLICLILSLEECITGLLFIPLYAFSAYLLFYKPIDFRKESLNKMCIEKNKSDKKLSVIVPIYNVEKYLERCVDSICSQNLKNIEVILVDDGSTDNSGKIADKLAEKYKDVVVFHKQNGGLSDARNFGVKHSSGKYLCFIDSDDYVNQEFKKIIYCLNEDIDIFFLGYTAVYLKKNINVNYKIFNQYFNNKDSVLNCLEVCTSKNSAWSKIIKKEFFIDNNLWFENGFAEDFNWLGRAMTKVSTSSIIPISYYQYIAEREGSLMNVYKKQRFIDVINHAKSIVKALENSSVDKIVKKRILQYIGFNIMSNFRKAKHLKPEEYKDVMKVLSENFYLIKNQKSLLLKIAYIFAKVITVDKFFRIF